MAWNMATNTEKREKWNMHTVGPRIWWEKWKSTENESHTVGSGIWQKKKKKKKKNGKKSEKCELQKRTLRYWLMAINTEKLGK